MISVRLSCGSIRLYDVLTSYKRTRFVDEELEETDLSHALCLSSIPHLLVCSLEGGMASTGEELKYEAES